MAKIKFENGVVVNFDGVPTQADIDEVARKLKITKNPTLPTAKKSTQSGNDALLKAKSSLGTGVLKGFGNTISGLSKIGESVLRAPLKAVLPKSAEKKLGLDGAKAVEQLGIPEKLKPKNTLEKVGYTGEQIAEFFLPAGVAAKAGKAVESAKTLSKLPKIAKATGFATQVAADTALSSGQVGLQGGTADDVKKNAALSVLLPVGAKVIGGASKVVGKVAAEGFGKATGAGSQAIKEAFENPAVMKYAREAGKNSSSELMEQSLIDAKKGLSKLKQNRSVAYKEQLATLPKEQKLVGILETAKSRVTSLTDDLDTVIEGKNVVDKAIKDVVGWSDNSVAGLDKLDQRLGGYLSQVSSQDKAQAKRIITILKEDIRDGLDKVPNFTQMKSGYRTASNLIDEITNALSLSDKKQKETAIRKLMQTVRRDDDSRKAFLEAVSEASGVDITAKISGAMLSPRFPRGLSGTIGGAAGSAGAIAGFVNPQFWSLMIPYAAASSPRLVGNVATIAGALDRNAKSVSPQIIALMRQTIMEIQKDAGIED